MSHLGYVAAAYAAAFAVFAGLVMWVAGDIRAQKRRLDALEPARRRDASGGGA